MAKLKKIKLFLLSKKKTVLFISLGLVFVLALAVAGFWAYEQKKRTLSYAVANINKAIAEDDIALLSLYVDFNLLSKGFVRDIAEFWPEIKINESRKRELENIIQQKIIAAVRMDELSGVGEKKVDKNVPPQLQAIERDRFFNFFPRSFSDQIKTKKVSVHREEDGIAILNAPVDHEEAGYSTNIKFLAQRFDGGWRVAKIINGYELIKLHMDALSKKNSEAEAAWLAYSEDARSRMSRYYSVTGCKAFFEPQEDSEGSFGLTIIIDGVNASQDSVRSVGMQCSLYDAKGNALVTMPLNSLRRIGPEESFRQRWFFEVTENTPELLLFTKEGELSCKTELSSIVLSNGSFIYTNTPPELGQVRP